MMVKVKAKERLIPYNYSCYLYGQNGELQSVW